MEGNKVGRRRDHDDVPNQSKRKRKREVEQDKSDSVQILGESQLHLDPSAQEHAKRVLANGACGTSGAHVNHMNMSRFPGPSVARPRDRANDEALREAPTTLESLPPNPCESDRMLFVQQWINSIPSDAALWLQTSLTQVIPISSTDTYPVELESELSSREDSSRLPSGTAVDVAGSHLRPSFSYHSKPSHAAANALNVLCSRYPTTAQHTNELINYSHNHSNEPGVNSTLASNHEAVRHVAGYHPRMMSCEMQKESGLGTAPVGRLFDDSETQLVVKLFRDYFTKGSCPILSEVRRRTANTVFEGRRTATSIRAKIKRLQTSGRWTDYAAI